MQLFKNLNFQNILTISKFLKHLEDRPSKKKKRNSLCIDARSLVVHVGLKESNQECIELRTNFEDKFSWFSNKNYLKNFKSGSSHLEIIGVFCQRVECEQSKRNTSYGYV